jgi:hypothetical protein
MSAEAGLLTSRAYFGIFQWHFCMLTMLEASCFLDFHSNWIHE